MNTFNIKLDKVRQLKFDNRAIFELEKQLGVSPIASLQDESKSTSIQFLASCVWAGLLHTDKLTFDEALDIIPLNEFNRVLETIVQALADAYGLGDAVEEKKEKLQDA